MAGLYRPGRPQRSSRNKLPAHLRDYVVGRFHDVTESSTPPSTTSSQIDRLVRERQGIEKDIDRYCQKTDKILHDDKSRPILEKLDARLEKSFKELLRIKDKILDEGDQLYPGEVEETMKAVEAAKEQVEDCQDKIAVSLSGSPKSSPQLTGTRKASKPKVTHQKPDSSDDEKAEDVLKHEAMIKHKIAVMRLEREEQMKRLEEREREKAKSQARDAIYRKALAEIEAEERRLRDSKTPKARMEPRMSSFGLVPKTSTQLVDKKSSGKGSKFSAQYPDFSLPSPSSSPFEGKSKRETTEERFQDDYTNLEQASKRDEDNLLRRFFQGVAKPDLPKFSGARDQFHDWWEQFDIFVNQPAVPVRFKMILLKRCLTGPPLDLIKRLGYTEVQYRMALQKLHTRYGGERRLLQQHIDAIMNVPAVKENDLKGLAELSNRLFDMVAKLTDASQEHDLTGPSALYTIVLKKIPDTLLIQYQNDHPWVEEDGLAPFVDWLNVQVAIRLEMAEIKESSRQRNESSQSKKSSDTLRGGKPSERQNRSQGHAASAEGLPKQAKSHSSEAANSGAAKPKPAFSCPLCQGSHGIAKCKKWLAANVEERWSLAKEHKVCFRCLYVGHQGKECKSTKKCDAEGCTKTHHRMLHPTSPSQSADKSGAIDRSNNAFGVDNSGKVVPTKVGLRVLPIFAIAKGGHKRKLLAFLDDGSDSSYIRSEIARSLGYPIEDTTLTLSTLVSAKNTIPSGLVSFDIESLDGEVRTTVGARTLDSMCEGLRAPDWTRIQENWEHLSGIEFPKVSGHRKIDILIGSDHPELTRTLEERVGKPGQPVARKTPLGWTCTGPLTSPAQCTTSISKSYSTQATVIDTASDLETEEAMRRLWNIDVLDVKAGVTETTPEERLALAKATASLKFMETEGRYQVSIPWKQDRPDLPDNRAMAEKRLRSLESSLQRRPEVAKRYQEVFDDNLKKGYISEVLGDDRYTPGWYLPHFGVVKEDRLTTKVRVVYDGAAVFGGTSLNDQMLPGPKLQQELLDILIMFREGAVALIGDIQEMFSQVLLDPMDRKYHRILWQDRIFESTRLPFGDRASPFLAQLVLRTHAERNSVEYPLASEACLRKIYMDDALPSVDGDQTAKQLRSELTDLLASAGFTIRKFCSNSIEVLMDAPEDSRAPGVIVDLEESELPCQKPLGILWNAERDAIGYRHRAVEVDVITKRTTLSLVARLFDPLQLLAPYVIRAKMALQEAWIAGLGWDDPFPPILERSIREWIDELPSVELFEVPRCYHSGQPLSSELHTFTDASGRAYGAVVYLRDRYADGSVTVRIVIAKARVTPLKAISIPRLELMGAVLGLRLAVKCRELLGVTSMRFWTDSMDVVFWVHGQSRRYKPFVAHRVAEVQCETSPKQWRHVPGKENPADLATRGATVSDLMENGIWTNGPEFLQLEEANWPPPLEAETPEFSEHAAQETPKSKSQNFVAHGDQKDSQADSIIDCGRYSSITRLIRVTAWVLRFVRLLKTRKKSASPVLEAAELDEAERYWIRDTQRKNLGQTVKELKGKGSRVTGDVKPLLPFLDSQGFVRVGGRLSNSDLPFDVRHPYIIPKDSHIAHLLIRRVHHAGGHVRGVNGCLADLRQKFWVVHGREELKKYDRDCIVCQMRRKRPFQQVMAPLPSHRITVPVRAFAKTGVDFAGPYLVKISRRTNAKRWLCLFTCTTSRAVHLEVAYGLDTDSFLLAFSRMVARRGRPELVISDNGTNFVGANRELGQLVDELDQQKIKEDAAAKGIEWRFNPPGGSHHGGFFEAMVKSAKKALKSILGEAHLTDEELHTAVVEVEGFLNSRPLTYCSDDPKDDSVLTPNHFLIGQAGGLLAPRIPEDLAVNPRRRWRYVQQLVTQIWQRWNKEFLTLLQTRGKWLDVKPDPEVGDIVLVADWTNPKGKWPLGRVVETLPCQDGHVRSVRVESRGKQFVRPISKLCPLSVTSPGLVVNAPALNHGGESVETAPLVSTHPGDSVTATPDFVT